MYNSSTAPFKCAVSTCRNVFTNLADHQLNATFKFHNFPKDPILKQKWKALCNVPLTTNTSQLKVCSDHFTLEDYNRNLKAEFLNDLKRTLKDTALPSVKIYPLASVNEEIVTSESISDPEGNIPLIIFVLVLYISHISKR